ncbi:hypothetical protein [Klebsiella aerogenes]|uniref:hypothetical protein n=1 Tax=Klebsiella aerogenes TaxID=548 RepID=UPI002D8108ED|nr:hypothetical protein [Klebsiella aerogenes]
MKNESGLTLNQLAERNANLVTEIEKCRELSGCPAGVDLQDWVKQMATENVALKDINAWCKTDAFKNMYREFKAAEALGCSDADCMHDAMLVGIMHAPETPATDRIVAGIKADGVDIIRNALIKFVEDEVGPNDVVPGLIRGAEICVSVADSLREGDDK